MKYFLILLLGLGAVSTAACSSPKTADVQQDHTFTLAVEGMT
ncbi:MAG: hypothetical protein ACI8QS_001661 [Planctomycetota bacterium]|jgi:hypothetical protein